MANVVEGKKTEQYLVGSWFQLTIDGHAATRFTDLSGIAWEVDAVEVKDTTVDGRIVMRKTPGTAKYGEITVKRLLSADKTWWDWVKKIKDRATLEFRTSASIVLFDFTMKPQAQWDLQNVWPSKWTASDLDVGSNDPMTEEMTLVFEHIKRTK